MFYSKKLNRFNAIKHCFFSRRGGYSKGLYKGLNCGRGSKDRKKNVLKNLHFVCKVMEVKKNNLILMNQTHSNKVVEIKKKKLKNINADSMITSVRGLALGVVTADCVPILIYDKTNNIIGCIHAGWRGAFSDIIKNTVSKIKKIGKESNIFATVGPCLGVKNYEVDLSFYTMFLKKSKKNKVYFSKKNKIKKLFNLRKYVCDKLLEQKVQVDYINRDTFKEKKYFFSYRRSIKLKQNDYGRFISVVKLV